MWKRREFLKGSAAVAGAATAGVLSAGVAARHGVVDKLPAPRVIQFAIFDGEIEESVLFAQELRRRGAQTFDAREDVGKLWFGELGATFAAGHAIAGLTSHTELLVCKEFSRQCGARLRFEGIHDCRGGKPMHHALRAAPSQLAAELAAGDCAWPQALAARLIDVTDEMMMREVRCRTSARGSSSNPGSLFSWLLA